MAGEVSISPGVQFKSVEGDPLFSEFFLMQGRPHLCVEAVFVHP